MKSAAVTQNQISDKGKYNEPLNVLLVGNNPIVLGNIYNYLKNFKGKKFIIDICFDCRESLMKTMKFKPNVILLDDTLNKNYLQKYIDKLNRHKKTAHIPITLLKSSNREVITTGIQEYLLKENLSAERLYQTIMNSIRFKKTIRLFKIARRRKLRQIHQFFETIKF
ncbi:MAG: hypothetical protein ACNS62_17590 [Candidatus Cyclobacteriaceae bacterium M3_2C_046]